MSGDLMETVAKKKDDGRVGLKLDKLASKVTAMSEESVDLKLVLYLSARDGPLAALCPGPPAGLFHCRGEEVGAGAGAGAEVEEEADEPWAEADSSTTAIEKAHQAIPPARLLPLLFKNPNQSWLPQETQELLYWILVGLKDPRLVRVEDVEGVLSTVCRPPMGHPPSPQFMFKLKYSTTSQLEMKWQALRAKCPSTQFGYFTTQVYNFHSIVHKGLKKRGVVVWKDPNACLIASKPSWVWGKSALGINLTVLSIVEYLEDPYNPPKPSKAYSFIVDNPGHVRIRYLMVYVNKRSEEGGGRKSPVGAGRSPAGALLGLALLAGLAALRASPGPLERLVRGLVGLASRAGLLSA